MPEVLKSAAYFVLILSVLVIAHEWGHFIVAKLCRMRVEDFSLFFGKVIWRIGQRNGTVYNVRSVPLGGFVKIAGMEPEDISNGAPIFGAAKNQMTGRGKDKTLRGLNEESLAGVDFDNVSPRVRDAVGHAVDDEAQLTEGGRAELRALLNTTGLNADEHRYLEAILGAAIQEPDPDGYNQKPISARAAVIFAGPLASLLFGYLIFCVMGFTTGFPKADTTISEVVKDRPAARAGLRAGDRVLAINGKPVNDGLEMVEIIRGSVGKPLAISARRGTQDLNASVTPLPEVVGGKTIGRIGIVPGSAIIWEKLSVAASIRRGTDTVIEGLASLPQRIFTRNVGDNVGGPVRVAEVVHHARTQDVRHLVHLSAGLSISLAVFNLLPIPILDGGHLLLLAIEGIRRRKLTSREVYAAQWVGLSIIGVLFVLIMFNDILRLVRG